MHTPESGAPRCVGEMLQRFERVARALENGEATGPYALDALLDDVELCPSLQEGPVGTSGLYEALHAATIQARNAVAVAKTLPASERTWVVERLVNALDLARQQFDLRVAETAKSGHPDELFSARCNACTFK